MLREREKKRTHWLVFKAFFNPSSLSVYLRKNAEANNISFRNACYYWPLMYTDLGALSTVREFHSGAVMSRKQPVSWFPKFKQKASTQHTGHQALL